MIIWAEGTPSKVDKKGYFRRGFYEEKENIDIDVEYTLFMFKATFYCYMVTTII